MKQPEFAALELRDRAVDFIAKRGAATEDDVVQHVYGGAVPSALRSTLMAPLLADPRLERLPNGTWQLRGRTDGPSSAAFVALALTATGPTPPRARLVRVCALRTADGEVVERFDATLNPERRVPRYVAERAGVEAEALNDQPGFVDVLDEFVRFLADSPVFAQDAHLTWGFVESEARRLERVLVQPKLVDVNDLASQLMALPGKPSLALIAAAFGISTIQVTRVEEEARVLALVGSRLWSLGDGDPVETAPASTTLRRGATARSLPDQPGVYVLRDSQQTPLYVGKARRLSSRLAAYVHRPLGPTRHLEGLTGAVHAVDSTECATDLEALILEDREIRRLQPRFNTVRQQRPPRYWIRVPDAGDSKRAPPRLELSTGPGDTEGQFFGPFRNETLADQARLLAREVFELDGLRRGDPHLYAERLQQACEFLRGDSRVAETLARRSLSLLRQVVVFNVTAMQLSADPRHVRYAVVRPSGSAVEGFLIDRAILRNWTTLSVDDAFGFARRLLEANEPRTTPDDVGVVLRWFGAQRPPARLVLLPDDELLASDAIEDAVHALRAAEG